MFSGVHGSVCMIVFTPSPRTMSADAATRTRERMRFFEWECMRKAKRHLETAMDIVLYYSSYV